MGFYNSLESQRALDTMRVCTIYYISLLSIYWLLVKKILEVMHTWASPFVVLARRTCLRMMQPLYSIGHEEYKA